MTKLLFFAALFISTNLYSQNLDGIMNIKFGSSIDVVKKAMLERPTCTIDEKRSDSSYLFFNEQNFGGRETLFILFKFYKNQFYTVSVFIRPAFEQKLTDLYTDLKKELETKYFKSKEYPKVPLGLLWEFKNKNSNEDIYNTIIMEVTERMNIKLTYQDGLLILPILKAQKVKSNSDY
jgi:hypothetical protein